MSKRLAVIVLVALTVIFAVFGFFPVGNSLHLEEFRDWSLFFSLVLLLGLGIEFVVWGSKENKERNSGSSSSADAFFYGLAFLSFLMLAVMVSVQLTFSPWAHSTMIGGKQETIQVSSVFSQIFPVVSTAATLFLTYVVFRAGQLNDRRAQAYAKMAARDLWRYNLHERYQKIIELSFEVNCPNTARKYAVLFFQLQEFQLRYYLHSYIEHEEFIEFLSLRRDRMNSEVLANDPNYGTMQKCWMSVRSQFLPTGVEGDFREVFDMLYNVGDSGIQNGDPKNMSDIEDKLTKMRSKFVEERKTQRRELEH